MRKNFLFATLAGLCIVGVIACQQKGNKDETKPEETANTAMATQVQPTITADAGTTTTTPLQLSDNSTTATNPAAAAPMTTTGTDTPAPVNTDPNNTVASPTDAAPAPTPAVSGAPTPSVSGAPAPMMPAPAVSGAPAATTPDTTHPSLMPTMPGSRMSGVGAAPAASVSGTGK